MSTPLYEAFCELALDKLAINPFHSLWEETLANWPLCPGDSLLTFCRTQYELRQEAIEAAAEALRLKEAKRQLAFDNEVKFLIKHGAMPELAPSFAQRIWKAGKQQKEIRKGFLVKPLKLGLWVMRIVLRCVKLKHELKF